MTDDEKLIRLAKMGIGCGKGCTCELEKAQSLSSEELAIMEEKYFGGKVVDLSSAEYRHVHSREHGSFTN